MSLKSQINDVFFSREHTVKGRPEPAVGYARRRHPQGCFVMNNARIADSSIPKLNANDQAGMSGRMTDEPGTGHSPLRSHRSHHRPTRICAPSGFSRRGGHQVSDRSTTSIVPAATAEWPLSNNCEFATCRRTALRSTVLLRSSPSNSSPRPGGNRRYTETSAFRAAVVTPPNASSEQLALPNNR